MATYTLNQQVISGESTTVGFQFYLGGRFEDQNNRVLGSYTMIIDTISNVTNTQQLDTGMVRLQLFFETAQGQHGHGGGGGANRCPETMLLEGANDFIGNPPNAPSAPAQTVPGRQIARACGSVAAATPQFASHLDKQWTLVGSTLTVA